MNKNLLDPDLATIHHYVFCPFPKILGQFIQNYPSKEKTNKQANKQAGWFFVVIISITRYHDIDRGFVERTIS